MPLLVHSGTAAINLGHFRITEAESAPEARRKSYSAQIAEAELVGIEMPEPAEWEARGRFYPNIRALEATTADWIYSSGLYLPKDAHYSNLFQQITVGPGMGPVAFSTATFTGINSWFLGASSSPFASPPPRLDLPIEKREMPVIGYRSWKLVENFRLGFGTKPTLVSLNQSFGTWRKGKNQAACKVGMTGHKAGDQNCHCGFYVLAEIDSAMGWAGGMSDDLIVGAVMGWGQVAQHGQEGWRAEFAQVIALLDCKYSAQQLKNTQRIAKAYGVGVFERSGLEAYVAEWGDPFAEPEVAVDG